MILYATLFHPCPHRCDHCARSCRELPHRMGPTCSGAVSCANWNQFSTSRLRYESGFTHALARWLRPGLALEIYDVDSAQRDHLDGHGEQNIRSVGELDDYRRRPQHSNAVVLPSRHAGKLGAVVADPVTSRTWNNQLPIEAACGKLPGDPSMVPTAPRASRFGLPGAGYEKRARLHWPQDQGRPSADCGQDSVLGFHIRADSAKTKSTEVI
jgi:hypothetical protein